MILIFWGDQNSQYFVRVHNIFTHTLRDDFFLVQLRPSLVRSEVLVRDLTITSDGQSEALVLCLVNGFSNSFFICLKPLHLSSLQVS